MATYAVYGHLTDQGARDIQKASDYLDLNTLTINGFGNVRTETCRAFDQLEFRTLVGQLP